MFNSYIIKIIKRNTELLKIVMSLYERNFQLLKEKNEAEQDLKIYINKYGKLTGDGRDNRDS